MPLDPMLAKESFDPAQTRVICDAFDSAWEILQKSRSRFADSALALAARTTLAKRIIEVAHNGAVDKTDLRNDALDYLHKNPPSG